MRHSALWMTRNRPTNASAIGNAMPMNDAQKIMSSASTDDQVAEGKLCRRKLGKRGISFSLLGKAERLPNIRLRRRDVAEFRGKN